jgi:hypothetical protein
MVGPGDAFGNHRLATSARDGTFVIPEMLAGSTAMCYKVRGNRTFLSTGRSQFFGALTLNGRKVMSKQMLYGLTVISVLALGIVTVALYAQGAQEKGAPPPAFSTKLIVVEPGPGVGTVLEKPEIRSIGGRTFVTGMTLNIPQLSRELFPGSRVWVPLEDVKRIVEIEDLEKMKKRFGAE